MFAASQSRALVWLDTARAHVPFGRARLATGAVLVALVALRAQGRWPIASPAADLALGSAPALEELPSATLPSLRDEVSVDRQSELDFIETSVPMTPLDEEDAAWHLAQALRDVLGSVPSEAAVAILWAHWAHETGRGRHMVGNNFAGIKGDGPSGGIYVWTRETTTNGKGLVRRTFRVYATAELGALDYVQLLSEHYATALRAAREGRVADFADYLGARGYFTEDVEKYRRAVTRLARECGERSLARRVLASMKAAGTRRTSGAR